jgi:SAM-dependent methyltransferase
MDRKQHWDSVWRTRGEADVSWYQPRADVSLELIHRLAPDRTTPIIDVGGGASTLADGLLEAGYSELTVLDIAPAALELARQRLGERARRVNWLAADVLEAPLPAGSFGVWHDRAVFHFLVQPADRERYVAQVRRAVRPGGHVIVAAFGLDGPPTCSGLDVVRYGPDSMHAEFGGGFRLLEHASEEHRTPTGRVQSFVWCLCRFGDSPAAPRG